MAIHEQALKRKLKQREKAQKKLKEERLAKKRQDSDHAEDSDKLDQPTASQKTQRTENEDQAIPEFKESVLPGTSAGILSSEDFNSLKEKVS